MSSKTTNLNLTKPSEDEFYDINVQNENMDIIDREIGGLKQPAYEVPTAMSDLHSGEMITVAFGKIAKAVSTLISHTTSKATNSVLGHVKLSDSTSSTSASTAGVAATPKAVKAAYDLANSNTEKIGTTDISGIGDGTVTGAIVNNKEAIEDVSQSLVKHSHTWDSITGKPSAFPPSSSDLLNKIYPVGSIYMSINNVSPQAFIGGTWEQIKNRWLVGAGDEYAVGTYGGNAVHSHTQRMIFTANYAGNNGLMYTAGGTTPTDVIYTGETRSVPPYYAVYMWKRIA